MNTVRYKPYVVCAVASVLAAFASSAAARDIRLQGTVTCKERGDVGARPARSILVVPREFVNETRLSNEQGLYQLELPAAKIIDKSVTFHFRNRDDEIGQQTEQIWEAQIRRFNNRQVFFPRTAEVEEPCAVAENDPAAMQERLAFFASEPEKARILLGSTAAGGGATVLASLPSFSAAAAGGPALPGGVFTVTGITPSDKSAGELSSLALSAMSSNPGFGFAPGRNIADAAFWNGAAIALSMHRAVAVASDFDEFSRFSIAGGVGDRFGLGLGVLKLTQEDRRTATLDIGSTRTQSFKYDELGVFLSGGVVLNPMSEAPVAVGVTFKHFKQDLQLPAIGDTVTNLGPGDPSWAVAEQDESTSDVDLSLSYQASPRLAVGLSLMSLLDEELTDENGADRSQRAAGLGVNYKLGRAQLGVDLIHRDEGGSDVALGANLVPFENGLIALGYDSTYEGYAAALSYYWLTYTYTDNDVFGTSHLAGVNYAF